MLKNEIDTIVRKSLAHDAGMCRHYLTLWSFIVGIEAENMFEFGSGFSTLTALSALKSTSGNLTTIDIRHPNENKELNSYFGREVIYSYGDRWTFYEGDSVSKFKEIKHNCFYDIVLHDGSHTAEEVSQDLKNILPYIKDGGFLLVHDTNHPKLGEEMREAVFGALVGNERFVTLPWGYGLTVIKVSNQNPSVKLTWEKQ